MASETVIKERLEFKRSALASLKKAYLALLDGGVKSFQLEDRTLTFLDLDKLKDQIDELETEIEELENALLGRKRMKRVIPIDW